MLTALVCAEAVGVLVLANAWTSEAVVVLATAVLAVALLALIFKLSAALALNPARSVAVISSPTPLALEPGGVPLNCAVVALKLSHVGSAWPLDKLAL